MKSCSYSYSAPLGLQGKSLRNYYVRKFGKRRADIIMRMQKIDHDFMMDSTPEERAHKDFYHDPLGYIFPDAEEFARQEAAWRARDAARQRQMDALRVLMRKAWQAQARQQAGQVASQTTRQPARARRSHRGAQTRSAAKSGDSNDDPDPDDQVISDPFAAINADSLTRPINRIARKAILAHRQGVDQTHPRIYNWHLTRTLKEIEDSAIRVLRKANPHIYPSQATLDELPSLAWRFFCRLAMGDKGDNPHDFGQIPNPVFPVLIKKLIGKSPAVFHDYVTRDADHPGQKDARKLAADLGIAPGGRRELGADVYEVADGQSKLSSSSPKVWTPDPAQAITPAATECEGVLIQHIPAQTVSLPRAAARFVRLDKDGAGDAEEAEAVGALDDSDAAAFDPAGHDEQAVTTRRDCGVLNPSAMRAGHLQQDDEDDALGEEDEVEEPESEVPDALKTSDDDDEESELDRKARRRAEAEQHTRVGSIARQLVNHVDRAPDRTAAARDVAQALNQQDGETQKMVLECIQADRANPDICAQILKALRFADAEALFSPKKPDLDTELTRLGRMGDATLRDLCTQHMQMLARVCQMRKSAVIQALHTRARNRKGRFPSEIVRVARLLLDDTQGEQ